MVDDVLAKHLLAGNSCNNCRHAKCSVVWTSYASSQYGEASGCKNPKHKLYGVGYVDLPNDKICDRWRER